jgi:hypothetical protein
MKIVRSKARDVGTPSAADQASGPRRAGAPGEVTAVTVTQAPADAIAESAGTGPVALTPVDGTPLRTEVARDPIQTLSSLGYWGDDVAALKALIEDGKSLSDGKLKGLARRVLAGMKDGRAPRNRATTLTTTYRTTKR